LRHFEREEDEEGDCRGGVGRYEEEDGGEMLE